MKPKICGSENLSEARALALLQQNFGAIRWPIVEAGSKSLVGFDAEEFSAAP